MSKNPPPLNDYSPALRAVLPLLFAAWSDAVLTPSEIAFLQKRVSEMKQLKEEELALIKSWSDPRNPPPRYLFEHWERMIIEAAQHLGTDSKKSLVALGMEMARQSARKADVKAWANADEKAALTDLEEALGLLSDDCLLYTSPSPRDLSTSRMPSSA